MKLRTVIILLIVIPITGLSLSNSTESSALELVCTEFWFYCSEPTVLEFPTMVFSVRNTELHPIKVICSQEIIEGFNISIATEWETIILDPYESRENRYSIMINETLSTEYEVRIIISQCATSDNETQATVSAIVLNHIVFYSELEGSLLNLQIEDQSGKPRNATISIKYKQDSTKPWTPIKLVNATSYVGYLPDGIYLVQAVDLDTNIYAEKEFYLTEDTTVYLELKLVGISFRLLTGDRLGLNMTVNNYVGTIEDVTIYAELYYEGFLVGTSQKYYAEYFHYTTGFRIAVWFSPYKWETGQYSVTAIIKAHSDTIVSVSSSFTITVPPTLKTNTTFFYVVIILVNIVLYTTTRLSKLVKLK